MRRPRVVDQFRELGELGPAEPAVCSAVVGVVYLAAILLPASIGRPASWVLMGLAAVGVLSIFFRLEAIDVSRGVRLGIALTIGALAAVVVVVLSTAEDVRLGWVVAGVAFTLALGCLGVDQLLALGEGLRYRTEDPEPSTAIAPPSRSAVIARRELRDEIDDAAVILGPAAEERLVATYGPDWLTTVNARRAAEGLRTFEPFQVRADPRAALSVIGHDVAFEPTAGRDRAKARFLLDVANRLHHPHRDISDDELARARTALLDLLDVAARI